MAARREGKRPFISISSSSEEEEEDDIVQIRDTDTENENDNDDDDYDEYQENDSYDDEDDEEEEDDDRNEVVDDESLCNKVIRFLKEGSDLECLNLKECKAYLRRHGLRISGTKLVCIQRIQDHQRLKNGNGEALYPRSSFAINCTGDVCMGDVVLFTQKVHAKFDKMTRHGRVRGKRTVAGRVVKESYGAAKQQHTFTVEVLWSRGIKKLCPLYPLLVKGRNLYKMRTFRQRWSNEAERSRVLDEKHRRGGAARLVRAMNKLKKWNANEGMKCQKLSHCSKRNKMGTTKESEKEKHCNSFQRKIPLGSASHNSSSQHREASPSRQMNLPKNARGKDSQCFSKRQKSANANIDRVPTLHPYSYGRIHHPTQIEFQHRSAPFPYFGYPMCSTSGYPVETEADTTFVVPASQFQRYNNSSHSHHGYIDTGYNRELNNWNRLSGFDAGRPFHPYTSGLGTYNQRGRGQRKSMPLLDFQF